jgi:hypothetical protein
VRVVSKLFLYLYITTNSVYLSEFFGNLGMDFSVPKLITLCMFWQLHLTLKKFVVGFFFFFENGSLNHDSIELILFLLSLCSWTR